MFKKYFGRLENIFLYFEFFKLKIYSSEKLLAEYLRDAYTVSLIIQDIFIFLNIFLNLKYQTSKLDNTNGNT